MDDNASVELWHATPVGNVASILADGLRTDAPVRTFRTGPVIYLARDAAGAHRWAAEIARELAARTHVALLRIDGNGLTLVGSTTTRIGIAQVTCRTHIAADRITLAGTFWADPLPEPALARPGVWVCEDCGCTYLSADGLECHRDDCEG